jgi:hypothetical protein
LPNNRLNIPRHNAQQWYALVCFELQHLKIVQCLDAAAFVVKLIPSEKQTCIMQVINRKHKAHRISTLILVIQHNDRRYLLQKVYNSARNSSLSWNCFMMRLNIEWLNFDHYYYYHVWWHVHRKWILKEIQLLPTYNLQKNSVPIYKNPQEHTVWHFLFSIKMMFYASCSLKSYCCKG